MAAAPDLATERAGASLRIGVLRLRVRHAETLPPVLPDRETLDRSLSAALGDLLDPLDPSHWVIRRLVLPFRAEAGPAHEPIPEAFARSLRHAIRRILAGEIVEGVHRYDSRAHWLAECLWSQAHGTAEGAWIFRRHRARSVLPAGDAVRLTVAAEPACAPTALALLARDHRIRTLAARIGEPACRAVLRSLLPAGTAPDPGVPTRLLRLIDRERSAQPGRPLAAALCAVLRARHADAGAPLPNLGAVLRPLLAIGPRPPASRAGSSSPDIPPRPQKAAASAKAGTCPSDPDHRQRPQGAAITPMNSLPAVELETAFAGVFVLWRSVVELDLLALLPQGTEAGRARLALAATLAGPDHEAAWHDPALHHLCDHIPDGPPPASPDAVRRFPAHHAARRHPRPVRPTLTRAGRLSVLRDAETGDWLALGGARACAEARATLGRPFEPSPAGARDPCIDLDWFGVRHRRARRGWAILARAAYADFGRRLYGLEGSSAAWLWVRLLAGWGSLRPGPPAELDLPRVPLDLVLRMGGLDRTVIGTPGGPVRLCLPGPQ